MLEIWKTEKKEMQKIILRLDKQYKLKINDEWDMTPLWENID